jgi:hypothetical protein
VLTEPREALLVCKFQKEAWAVMVGMGFAYHKEEEGNPRSSSVPENALLETQLLGLTPGLQPQLLWRWGQQIHSCNQFSWESFYEQ